ncbi:DNA polymerase III subunit epsilon [Buchnera aphidicola (Anoecia corni)]|uniref:DNA polymerase III subunit epsilon n=2 Tax=Buchnera aphidicola TaxID=9 RepID=A0AAT9IGJ0_9GAMM
MNTITKREIVIDTETTGMNSKGCFYKGHRIIEISCIEIFNRNITGKVFHTYLQPDRTIDDSAYNIHGISENFLHDKPKFKDVVKFFFSFIKNSNLIIHNAMFDIAFINYELELINFHIKNIEKKYKVIDSLSIARNLFPGKKNNLNALCDRYKIENKSRKLHSALLDSQLLAKVYLKMTSYQKVMCFDNSYKFKSKLKNHIKYKFIVIFANEKEIHKHDDYLFFIKKITKLS